MYQKRGFGGTEAAAKTPARAGGALLIEQPGAARGASGGLVTAPPGSHCDHCPEAQQTQRPTLTPADKQWIIQTFQQILAGPRASYDGGLSRLTIEQFAAAVELHPDTVRRKIRVGYIPDALVFGLRDKRISPKALEQFGVTPPEARARIAAFNLLPVPSPSIE